MSKSLSIRRPFRFQRFSVNDQNCAMKIGTDGILLGAWCSNDGRRILDIGTGCGLIALMLAQRTESSSSEIEAIDIDESSVLQARKNIEQSPWNDRIQVHHQSLWQYASRFIGLETLDSNLLFDQVVCNPPYFEKFELPSPALDASRQNARQMDRTTRQSFIKDAAKILRPDGKFALILPFDQAAMTINDACQVGLQLVRQASVRPLPDAEFKRVLLEFKKTTCPIEVIIRELTIESTHHQYTKEFEQLTEGFYLRFSD